MIKYNKLKNFVACLKTIYIKKLKPIRNMITLASKNKYGEIYSFWSKILLATSSSISILIFGGIL
jgi:hypothetical protein